MKALTTAGLTKLIQLIKSNFISTSDTVTTNTVTLATVATSGSYNDLSNKPTIPTVDQTYDGSSANAQSGIAIEGAGFLTGITSSDVTNALGYTPYNSTNPNSYLSSSDFKTINNTSIVGSGNIDTSEIFIATYGTTTYADVLSAYNAGKTIIAKNGTAIYTLIDYSNSIFTFLAVKEASTLTYLETEHYILTSSGWSTVTGFSTLAPDLSNLSSTGKTVIDGQWTSDGSVIVEGLQLHTNNDISYPVAVPNDGHKYEVILSCLGVSTTTSGQPTALFISSSELNYAQCVYRGTPRSAANVMVGGSIIIPLGTDRGITIQRSEDYYGTANIYLRGYRRIGSNT